MAGQVVWTGPAEKDREDILTYWKKRNGSWTYSLKLNALFQACVKTIINNPFIGRPSDIEGIRVKAVEKYLLFYEVTGDVIVIHHIWDGRRDLTKLKF